MLLAAALLPRCAAAQGINPLPLIIQAESSGNPTAQSKTSTASGLAGDINGTWAAALTACGGGCGSVSQYPTAASAPASVQIAANNALINQNGLRDWLCANCDAHFASQVAAAGGVGAFQTSGLDTNPADFAAADTPAGLASFVGGTAVTGTPLATSTGTATTPTTTGGGNLTTGIAGTATQLTPNVADAAPPRSGILDEIVRAFGTATSGWQSALYTSAFWLFSILAAFELFLSFIFLVIGGGHPDWSEVAATLIRWLLPVGLFLWLMQHGSEYTADIVNSLRQAGADIGGKALTPSAFLAAGVTLVSQVWQYTHALFHPAVLAAEMLTLVVIMIAFALLAVWFAATLIEAYFIIGAAALFLAFGAMRWSRNIAVSVLMYSLAVGFKLFAMEAIVAVTTTFIQQWMAATAEIDFQALFTLMGFSIFLAAVAKVVPDKMQGIVLGMHLSMIHHSHVTQQAAGAAAIAATPVLAATGFTALAVQAFREAAEKMSSSGQQQSQSALGRAGQMAFGVGQSLATAAGSEISGRLGGLYRGGPTASAARMATNIQQSRRVAAAQNSRPQPPSNNP
jgi:type IV secretion system protein TrbL